MSSVRTGGNGVVTLGDGVARKRYSTWRGGGSSDAIREICALYRFKHRAVLAMRAWGYESDGPVVTLPLCACNLRDRLRGAGLTPHEQKCLATNVLTAVAYVHREGFFHRDVKPDNVLCAPEAHGTAFTLADFGTCVRHVPGKTYTIGVCTPMYAAPEMLQGDGVYGLRVDWWSVGLVLREARLGVPLVCGKTADVLATLDEAVDGIPAPQTAAERLEARMIVRDPAARWSTYACRRATHGPRVVDDADAVWSGVLNPRMRPVLFEWMGEVCARWKIAHGSFVEACAMVREVLIARPSTPDGLQLLGCACLHLAQHLYETTVFWPEDYVYITCNSFTEEEFGAEVNAVFEIVAPRAYGGLGVDADVGAMYVKKK